ncbi:hypothetical protein [Streptomyces acidicola]|uniref:hypothetical protein n=1 Tax=Streptomyces acidicola TaxID=2596892 RepID=UPI0037F640EB
MQGPGYVPQPPHSPSQGAQITLRAVFVALAVFSCGFLAWPSMLRLAVVTRKPFHWALFGVAAVHIAIVTTLIAIDQGEDEFETPGNTGMWLMLLGMVTMVAYYLYADIRHFGQSGPTQYAQSVGYTQPPQTGYGYPGPQPFPPSPPVQPQPPIQPQTQGQPQQTQPRPQPQRPAPARIDQVRAELDELSDYLRKHEGGR